MEKHLRSFFVRQTTERQREIVLAVFLSRSSLFDQNSVPFLRLLAPTDRQSLRRRLKIPDCLSSGVDPEIYGTEEKARVTETLRNRSSESVVSI